MVTLTPSQIATALINCGNYRVKKAHEIALEGDPDGISGDLLLSLGLRESNLNNINNAAGTDRGCFQISDTYHHAWLSHQPGCKAGTWREVPQRLASEPGYCPRFGPAARKAIEILHEGTAYGKVHGVRAADLVRFAIAAYNAGVYNALSGYRDGDVDRYTTGRDYSAWVLAHKPLVAAWIHAHPAWQ